MDKLDLIAVKTSQNMYLLSERKAIHQQYGSTCLGSVLINGELAKSTFHSKWFLVDEFPEKIEARQPNKQVNYRYELIEPTWAEQLGIPFSIPQDVMSEYDTDSDKWFVRPEYEKHKTLYALNCDVVYRVFDPVEFDVEVLGSIGYVPNIGKDSMVKFEDLQFEPVLSALIPPVALPTKPCSLTSEKSYDIVRRYVQEHIDPKSAVITSDYDFCFTVKRILRLPKVLEWAVNVNEFTKRKPRWETRSTKEIKEECFAMTHRGKMYNGYKPIEGFTGENVEDLNKNIRTFCEDLMKDINTPVIECESCTGTGVHVDRVLR